MQGNPLPESCVMLFTTLCTGWILKKRTRNILLCTPISKTRKLHGPASIWEHEKNVKLRRKQFHMKDMGKSSPRKLRRAIYYTLHRTDPKKRNINIVFLQHSSKFKIFENWGKHVYIPPLTPDQPPFKGGYLC